VAYSTCSVHRVENEDVVAQALRACPHFALEAALPAWPRRGEPGACPGCAWLADIGGGGG
jgi:16S rRNA C967 or C1407 C5-methylase (RsmB/RsmF family)